jgi:hypothetical protein
VSESTPPGTARSVPLDPRLNQLLLELPDALSKVVGDLIREREQLVALAEHRAERLQRLQEVGAALSRSLDRDDVERELARHVARMIACTGVVVARSADAGDGISVVLHWRGGREENVEGAAPVLDAVAETSRTGRTVADAMYGCARSSRSDSLRSSSEHALPTATRR